MCAAHPRRRRRTVAAAARLRASTGRRPRPAARAGYQQFLSTNMWISCARARQAVETTALSAPMQRTGGQRAASAILEIRLQLVRLVAQRFVAGARVLRQVRIADERAERLDQAEQDALRRAGRDALRLDRVVQMVDGRLELLELRLVVVRAGVVRLLVRHGEGLRYRFVANR
ncbi:hypothetical protein DM49_3580 [Burkholderia mallei]|nr:hypothetical protein DM49_3580 [Burkholderia mallei]